MGSIRFRVTAIAVITSAIIGAGLGFLWYNAPPAMVFMGDTGSLSLGARLGSIAVATEKPSRITMPEEKVRTGWSIAHCSRTPPSGSTRMITVSAA